MGFCVGLWESIREGDGSNIFSEFLFNKYILPRVLITFTFSSSSHPVLPPVIIEETKVLITQLKTRKAAGSDAIPPDLLKYELYWWASLPAPLFTAIDNFGKISKFWTNTIIDPIYKKGDPHLPEHFRPISLLSVTGNAK